MNHYMVPITEIREGLPSSWSDDQAIEFHNWLQDFIEGMLEIVEKDRKNTTV